MDRVKACGGVSRAEQGFQNLITRFLEAEAHVTFAGAVVFTFHVEPDAAAVGVMSTQLSDVGEELSENPATAMQRMHIDTLDPPDLSVSPITPLERMRRLAHDFATDFGHEISSSVRFGNETPDSRHHNGSIQLASLGFSAERDVEINDDSDV